MRRMYDYECPACGAQAESLQGADDPEPECSACGAEMARSRVPTKAPGAQFNGEGWAQDLYCSVTPAYKEAQERMKNVASGRYRPDGRTLKSGLRGE